MRIKSTQNKKTFLKNENHNNDSFAIIRATAQTVVSKSHSSLKGRVWRDDSIFAKHIYKISLGYLVVPERK